MRELARRAVAAVSETYGAVDVLVGTDGKFYVLEVNCAPAMDEYTLASYVRAIRKRFAHEK
jgi:D-alanine-D-alanine ligase-like ATP-grasp enzyme